MRERIEHLTPEEVILEAFDKEERQELSLKTLIAYALRGNCPSADIAKRVIANMVQFGMLTFRKEQGQVYFKKTQPQEAA